MKQIFDTYFVETHEYDIFSSKPTLVEYFPYESGVHGVMSYIDIEAPTHSTVLSIAVF